VPAAALIADSSLRNYGEYVEVASQDPGGDSSSLPQEYNGWYGGSFWDHDARERWLVFAPAFSADTSDTPILFVYNGSPRPMILAEAVGTLALNHRESDVLMIPRGDHQLILPRQRQVSMQSSVDWMLFWLVGQQDNDPAKADQYWYWRRLRDHRDARHASTDHHSSPVDDAYGH
jgi:hypothetical protein